MLFQRFIFFKASRFMVLVNVKRSCSSQIIPIILRVKRADRVSIFITLLSLHLHNFKPEVDLRCLFRALRWTTTSWICGITAITWLAFVKRSQLFLKRGAIADIYRLVHANVWELLPACLSETLRWRDWSHSLVGIRWDNVTLFLDIFLFFCPTRSRIIDIFLLLLCFFWLFYWT